MRKRKNKNKKEKEKRAITHTLESNVKNLLNVEVL
jgi:hypothetical protein